ncbi:hypothetical protein [Actinoplanes sp. NPDC051851]|uniref:hypothetical protein n=1 Tax=Actinoplanes sp. NPDC051851 TaxID=3154753 RepID=UPI00342BC627
MKWILRGRRRRFPPDMLDQLEMLGRYRLDRHHCGLSPLEVLEPFLSPYMQDITVDRDGLLGELAALVAGDEGGFATHGAACLTWDLLDGEIEDVPAAWPLIDAGIAFKLDRGLGEVESLTINEQVWYRGRKRAT